MRKKYPAPLIAPVIRHRLPRLSLRLPSKYLCTMRSRTTSWWSIGLDAGTSSPTMANAIASKQAARRYYATVRSFRQEMTPSLLRMTRQCRVRHGRTVYSSKPASPMCSFVEHVRLPVRHDPGSMKIYVRQFETVLLILLQQSPFAHNVCSGFECISTLTHPAVHGSRLV